MDHVLEDEQFEEDQDLLIFNQHAQQEAMRAANLDIGLLINKNEENKQRQANQKKQYDVEENQAKQLRISNTIKFFQKIKLMFLKQVHHALHQAKYISKIVNSQMLILLSKMSPQLIHQFYQLKQTKSTVVNIDKYLLFLTHLQTYLNNTNEEQCKMNIIFWIITETLGIGCRRLNFFDLGQNVDQIFYNLNYKHCKIISKQKKKLKSVEIITNNISRMITEEQLSSTSSNFQNLNEYSFNSKQPSNLQQNQVNNWKQIIRTRKMYKEVYFQIYSTANDGWLLVNVDLLQVQSIESFKMNILDNLNIIGFYATKIIHFKPQYHQLSELRTLGNIQIDDMTMFFADKIKDVVSRRKRVGCRFFIRQILQRGSYDGPLDLLTTYQSMIWQKSRNIEKQKLMNQFPINNTEMNLSDYFVLGSRTGKYKILSSEAQPVGRLFDEEPVYLQKDLIAVSSKMGWVDFNRKVKLHEQPVKKTQNKNKNVTELYQYSQTQPYSLRINPQTGQFVPDDQYNSVYLPPNFTPPSGIILLNKSISYICKKYKIYYCKAVQGFTSIGGGRCLPNSIGYLLYEKDLPQVLQLYQQRQQMLNSNKEVRKDEQNYKMWKQLFKSIKLFQAFAH